MIRVGFSTRKDSILGKLFLWATGGTVSHSWLLVEDHLFGMKLVMEACEHGIRLTPYEYFKTKNDVIWVTDTPWNLSYGLKVAAHWLGKKHDNGLFRPSRAKICSSFVARVLVSSYVPGTGKLDPATTSPQALFDFIWKARSGPVSGTK